MRSVAGSHTSDGAVVNSDGGRVPDSSPVMESEEPQASSTCGACGKATEVRFLNEGRATRSNLAAVREAWSVPLTGAATQPDRGVGSWRQGRLESGS